MRGAIGVLALLALTGAACTALLGIDAPGGGGDDGDDSGAMCVGIDLATDELHCGGCNDACSTSHGTPTCGAGECTIACTGSFRDCTGGARADGCESDLDRDPAHCGACDMPCPTAANANTTCAPGGVCGLACKPLFDNCETSVPDCETSVGSDADNCGACGKSCLGGGCSAGKCQAFAITTNLFHPGALAVDDEFVYFVRVKPAFPYDLMRVKKDGSTAPEALGSVASTVTRIAVDPSHLYYLEGNTLKRVDKLPPAEAGTVFATQSVGDFVVDGGFVYDCAGPGIPMAGSTMRRTATVSPGMPTDLAPIAGSCRRLLADGSNLYWIEDTGPPSTEGTVRSMNKSNGSAPGSYGMACAQAELAQDSERLFMNNDCKQGASISTRDKLSGLDGPLLDGKGIFTRLVVDGTHIYVVATPLASTRDIVRYQKNGSGEHIVHTQNITDFIVAAMIDDGDALYFSDDKGQELMKLAK